MVSSRSGAPPYGRMSITESTTFNSSPFWLSAIPSLVHRKLPKTLLRRAYYHYVASYSNTQNTCLSPSPQTDSEEEEEELELAGEDQTQPMSRCLSEDAIPSRPSSSRSATSHETSSGIQWTDADIGLAMLASASRDSSTTLPLSGRIRRDYIDGVTWILRGLPGDLTTDEILFLQQSLPPAIFPDDRDHDFALANRLGRPRRQHVAASTLHRIVAACTLYFFLTVSLLLPYVHLLFQQAYQFDRRHKITDRIVAQSVVVADVVSRRTWMLAGDVCAMNDGKVGEGIREVGVYLLQGFGGGVYAGFGEGVRLLGLGGYEGEDGDA